MKQNEQKPIPNTHLICYADEQMQTSQNLCMLSAKEKGGLQFMTGFGPDVLHADTEFYHRNKTILEAQQRGGGYGYWLFKPYICCMKALDLIDGEYVVYADAGVEFINSIKPIIDKMEKTAQKIFLFGNGHRHVQWCKKRVLESMIPDWFNRPMIEYEQVQASVIIFKVCDATRQFMREWLAWSEIPGFIDDSYDKGVPGTEGAYGAHRNDQSILTNLAILWGVPVHWWPVQYGKHNRNNYPNDNFYDQLFYHHRYRESDWLKYDRFYAEFMTENKSI